VVTYVTNEVARLIRDTATRVTTGTPIAPIVRAVFGEALPALPAYDAPSGLDGDAWAARVADAEQALAIGLRRTTELQTRHERTIAELRDAHARERALHAELAATVERSAAEREAISRRADEVVVAAESARAAAARDAEAARVAFATAQQASLAHRSELTLARSEMSRLATLAEEAQQSRDAMERDASALRGRFNECQERLRVLEVELARVSVEQRRTERASLGEQAEREARWQDELSNLRLQHARERDRAQALGEELERLRVESEARARREERLQEELRAVAARADADREETVRRAQDMVQSAEQARALVTAELATVRGSLSNDRARLLSVEADREKTKQGFAERDAALASAKAMIVELEAARAAAAGEFDSTRTRLTETERELLAVQHELGTARRQLDKLCTTHDDLVEDNARVSAFLEETRASEVALRAQTEELREQIRALESERARLTAIERRHEHSTEELGTSSAALGQREIEVKSLRAWSRTLETEVAYAAATLEQATARERRLQEMLAASEQGEHEHQETLAAAQALATSAEQGRAAVVAELEAMRMAMASAQRVILEAEEETRVARAEAERLAATHEAHLTETARTPAGEQPTTPAKAAEPKPAVPLTAAAPIVLTPPDTRVVAIIDTTPEWPATGGVDVHVVAPGDGIVARIGELGAGRCIVNLAAAGAIAAAAELRMAGVAVPLWGTIVVAGGERGLSLGQIEVLSRPIDPDLVRSQCVSIAPKNARILAIGSDSSTFIALRQGLMKAGMSVSIAWDLKQATELMEIVRPHMVVLDLTLPGRGAASLVAELARLEAPPVLVVLPGKPEQLASFSAALGAFVPVDGARSQANLLRVVIDSKR
jgi:CheY-like chemotaxis protein